MEFTTQLTMKNLTSSADFAFLPLDLFIFFSELLKFFNLGNGTKYQTENNSQEQKDKDYLVDLVVLYFSQRTPYTCHLTSVVRIPDRDVVCGRNAWTISDSETCHQDLHHWASSKIPVLLDQFFACKQRNTIRKENKWDSSALFKPWDLPPQF